MKYLPLLGRKPRAQSLLGSAIRAGPPNVPLTPRTFPPTGLSDRLCQRTKWEMTFLGARFPCFDKRRICHLAGLIRQYRTKSYRAFCEADVEKLKKFSLHSVYLTYWCPPPGIPLSAICMDVSKVSLSKATRGLNVELSGQTVDPEEALCIFFG